VRSRTLSTVGICVAALATAFFLVRLLGAPWPHFPPSYPDSFSYLKVATRGPLQPGFYFDERPIGYPFLLWVVGRSSTLAVVAQTLIYVGSFWFLGWVVATVLKSRVVVAVALVFIAALAIEPRNATWNTVILSESLSTSLSVLSIATWLLAAGRPSKRTITWAWMATAAWILVRDTNVLPTVLVIVPAVLIFSFVFPAIDRTLRRRLVAGAVAITLVCGYVYMSQAVTHRTQYSVYNFTGMRVLPDPTVTKWFAGKGMPLDDALRGRTNHNAWDDGPNSFLAAPALAKYRTWARGAGGRWLLISMAALAPTWWTSLHHELPHILRDNEEGYDSYAVFNRFPHHFPPPFGEPRTPAALWAMLALTVAGLAYAATDRRRRVLAFATSVLFVSAIVDVWTSYVGDPMEVDRHLVGPLARLSVTAIFAVALGVDALVARLREPRPVEHTAPEPVAREEKVTVDA